MRSKAQIKRHPLHPILIAFPIAFGFGCVAFDIAGRLGDWPTGQIKAGPATHKIGTYAVEESGHDVKVVVPADGK